ncbi:hypothetical protein N9W33_02100 [Flavobacteriaceae bacterium]|nr:hypothetical protein [Flavobacteriaceae bacterium]MDC0462607.1 hypothetical protein [Flavobacteriaceae bacterium]
MGLLIFIGIRTHDAVQWTCCFAQSGVIINEVHLAVDDETQNN